MSKTMVDTSVIPGWGTDADPQNDPTYPLRHIEGQEDRGLSWKRPALQQPGVEVLSSIEYNRLPAVIGTSTPPSGLSGMIRRYAFRRSESDWRHWLLLMGADRINVVEGVVADLGNGTIPNIPAEMGIRAEWQHNRRGLATKLAVVTATSLVGYFVLRSRKTSADRPTTVANDRLITSAVEETALSSNLKTYHMGKGEANRNEAT